MTKCDSITIYWLYNIFKKVLRQPLKMDGHSCNFDGYTYSLGKQLQLNWNLEMEQRNNPNLFKILFKTFGIWQLIVGTVYSSIEMISRIQIPLYVGCIVSYYASVIKPVSSLEMHQSVAGLVIFSLLIAVLHSPMKIYAYEIGTKMRVACSSLVYQKSLNIRDCKPSGLVLRLLTKDVHCLDTFLIGIHHIWRTPLEAFMLVYVLYREMGAPAILGMLVMLTAIPIQTVLTRLIIDCEMHLDRATDKRVNFVKEILNGIKVIKMYAWEQLFVNTVQKLRAREINVISQYSYLHSVLYSLNVIPRSAAFVTFLTFILSGNVLLSKQVFTVSLIYQFLNISILQSFPTALAEFVEAINSIYRIERFLLSNNGNNTTQIIDLLNNRIHSSNSTKKGISLDNVTATWKENGTGIYSIDVNFQSNRIYGITGKMGCGKSSLLKTVIGELEPNKGKIEIAGTISYASQEPWLFNETIKQNIICGAKFDENRYITVCRVCALDRDFQILRYGEETKVNEKGHSLSDEQTSKINFARAIYREADIYLIDDQLCLGNAYGGSFIFENCIQNFLKGKCVILITNEKKYLQLVDQTITIENGRIKEIDKFERSVFEKPSNVTEHHKNYVPINYTNLKEEIVQDSADNAFRESQLGTLSILQTDFRTLKSNKLLGVFVGLVFFTQVTMSGIDIFVSKWADVQGNITNGLEFDTDTQSEDDSLKIKPFVYIYSILIITVGYLTFQRTLTMFGMSLDISRTLHNKVCQVIINAPLQFFDGNSTPEKIIQSFSHHMKNIDLNLPLDLLDCLTFTAEVLFIIIFILNANLMLIIPTLAVILVFYGIRKVFLKSARRKANIEEINLNAFKAYLHSSIQGGSIIRANNTESYFINEFNKYLDNSLAVTFLCNQLTLFTYALDIVCFFYIILIPISHLFMAQTEITGSSIGLAITYTIILNDIIQRGLRKSVDFEMRLSSVTNILKYYDCECEPSATTHGILPTTYGWPKHGQIVYKNFNLKNPDFTLNNGLNFEIKSKEKIAIFGTKKSLIINSLFRFYETKCGSIKIDGVDTQKINLYNLRRKLSVILQDPEIFAGTVRFNLDPLNERSDSEIMKLLCQIVPETDLDGAILNLNTVAENLTNRQKQLICLTRALLRQNKILIVDESNIENDDSFSKIIHRTIEKLCADCTVVMLANRLNHIMNCDRIMILDEGRLVEYDHPYKLIEKSNKLFNELLGNYDENQRNELINIAKRNYKLL